MTHSERKRTKVRFSCRPFLGINCINWYSQLTLLIGRRSLSTKTSILQKGFWRRRPLYWIELKYTVEELITKFENSSNLRNCEYISYRYVMKWVNLIPFFVVLIMGLVFAMHSNEVGQKSWLFRSNWTFCAGKC